MSFAYMYVMMWLFPWTFPQNNSEQQEPAQLLD